MDGTDPTAAPAPTQADCSIVTISLICITFHIHNMNCCSNTPSWCHYSRAAHDFECMVDDGNVYMIRTHRIYMEASEGVQYFFKENTSVMTLCARVC